MKTKLYNFAKNILIPLIPMVLWGSLFPFVKMGYEAFEIDPASVPDIIVFAAMRFLICGVIILAISAVKRDRLPEGQRGKTLAMILAAGLFSIVLHYAFTYISLATTGGGKTAIIKQIGSLMYLCAAPLFIKEEKFSLPKLFGTLIGFAGIICINLDGGGVSFTIGDFLLLLASFCSVISMIINKKSVTNCSPFLINGISQSMGGAVLLVAGLAVGGSFPRLTLSGILVLTYICTASIIAYVLFNYLQRSCTNSKLLIIKFAEPLFACIFGAILLGEDIFKLQYLAAFLLICGGIVLGNLHTGHGQSEKKPHIPDNGEKAASGTAGSDADTEA